jgi:hypothetical protein
MNEACMEDLLHWKQGAWSRGKIIANFELRNREPARRVGVRRTISNLGRHGAEGKVSGVRCQRTKTTRH